MAEKLNINLRESVHDLESIMGVLDVLPRDELQEACSKFLEYSISQGIESSNVPERTDAKRNGLTNYCAEFGEGGKLDSSKYNSNQLGLLFDRVLVYARIHGKNCDF